VITPDEFYMLRGSRTSQELLAELTRGDPDEVTEKTPLEVRDEIRRRAVAEARAQYEPRVTEANSRAAEAEAKRAGAQQALEAALEKEAGRVKRRNDIALRIGKAAGWCSLIITVLPAVGAFICGAVEIIRSLFSSPPKHIGTFVVVLDILALVYIGIALVMDVFLGDGPVRRVKSWTTNKVTDVSARLLHRLAGHAQPRKVT
jgi:hypothetical protein